MSWLIESLGTVHILAPCAQTLSLAMLAGFSLDIMSNIIVSTSAIFTCAWKMSLSVFCFICQIGTSTCTVHVSSSSLYIRQWLRTANEEVACQRNAKHLFYYCMYFVQQTNQFSVFIPRTYNVHTCIETTVFSHCNFWNLKTTGSMWTQIKLGAGPKPKPNPNPKWAPPKLNA